MNLFDHVILTEKASMSYLAEILQNHKKTIVFCHMARTVEDLAAELKYSFSVFPYTGQDKSKVENQYKFEAATD